MDKKPFKEMFDAGIHIGHRTSKWNPRMKKFLYGEKNGIHILNLEKTADYLDKALEFLSRLSSEGKLVLFVSTKPQSINIVKETAQRCNMPYVISKWIPGLLTNFSTLKTRIKYLKDLKEQEVSGEFEKYTKKEAANLRKIIHKLELSLGGVQNLASKPDAVFILDTTRDFIVVKEAKKLGIPVVGIVDTNADPDMIDYPIPANDDALKSIKYLLARVEEFVGKESIKTKKKLI